MKLPELSYNLAHLAPSETLTLPPTQEINTEEGSTDPQAIATFSSIKYLQVCIWNKRRDVYC